MSEYATALVTAADISRLAGVTRATVSNWRRRHADFPAPVGGTDTSPAYDLAAVRAWLSARGQLPENSPADELRLLLRAQPETGRAVARLFPVVLAAAGLSRADLVSLPERSDDELASWTRSAVNALADEIPGVAEAASGGVDASLLRALVRAVIAEGAEATAGILFERLLEDSSVTGTYLTPGPLAELMTALLAEDSGAFPKRVLDPACGSGSLLAAAARTGATEVYGQDVLTGHAARAAVRLRLGAPAAAVTVRAGDSLRSDAFPDLAVDAVLCNPPYGDRAWGHDELAYDERWAYGVPPRGESELAWIQHCLAHLAPGAHAVLLMPPAVAERASGRRIRSELVRGGVLRAVIALPQGIAMPLHIGLHLWVLRRPGPDADVPPAVLFLDATSTKKQDHDWAELRETVLAAWRAYRVGADITAVPAARAVPLIDLLDEAADLTPVRHVRGGRTVQHPGRLARQGTDLRDRLHQAATQVSDLSRTGDWPPTGDRPREWRTATVADLLRGGALDLLHATPRGSRRAEPEPLAPGDDARPVLTAKDVVTGRPASGTSADRTADGDVHLVRPGDVLLPEIFRGEHPSVTRVAEDDDAGCVLGPHLWLFRPDPQRLDPWFLAGFLSAEENVSAATTGSSLVRIHPRRLRVPLLPLVEQRRYGDAFRHLHVMRTTARRAAEAAEETARVLGAGLTGGALLPPGHESP
ncbi:N-6 DNA methylase [Actinoallomurus soli]|uniref:N-6 DNA methylase n=1 Tax=Actinoallomurus soli TaxID=2952535 RepID=UPI0020938EFE|nr:N-6 DNA methylase [Actinoallomurus soli]MCO5967499.1 N-6 DNA methylase [Actinoallomurus soli]